MTGEAHVIGKIMVACPLPPPDRDRVGGESAR